MSGRDFEATAFDYPDFERVLARIEAAMPAPDGRVGRQAQWVAEDGWIIGYTTTRVRGGPFGGRFAVLAYKPVGPGARTGRASCFERVYFRGFATRRAAKARAEQLYRRHSPRWAARHPDSST